MNKPSDELQLTLPLVFSRNHKLRKEESEELIRTLVKLLLSGMEQQASEPSPPEACGVER